ncbi:MAG: DUF4163 domain-containing protein [Deltaproteobacteria bacterium]|jgi:hypothetical protein|nr:DUF4163 domain-containing protein [Deltaproteobacteria bacterium]
MKNSPWLILIILLTLAFFYSPQNVLGDEPPVNPKPVVMISPEKITLSFTAEHAICPKKIELKTSMSYPQWTGNPKVDETIATKAATWIEDAKKQAIETLSDVNICPDHSPDAPIPLDATVDYEYFNSSPNFVSLLFTDSGFTGGAHGYLNYHSLNFNLETGEEVKLSDLFPDTVNSLTLFFEYIYVNTCLGENNTSASIPNLYGDVPCDTTSKKVPPPPQEFLNNTKTLVDLGNLVLTKEGALINIDPYDAWSWAQGPFKLSITKNNLITMGAPASFWETSAKTPPAINASETMPSIAVPR